LADRRRAFHRHCSIAGATAGYFSGLDGPGHRRPYRLDSGAAGFLIIAILSPVFHGKTWLIFVILLALSSG